MKYIPLDKLKVELKKRMGEYDVQQTTSEHPDYEQGAMDALYNLNLQLNILVLQQEQPVDGDDEKFVKISVRKEVAEQFQKLGDVILAGQSSFIRAMNQQEQPEVDLDKFTEKIKTFQGKYKHPEIVSIKGAMAFMARMFYQYPNVARQWYEQLPNATMDNARKEK